MIILLKNDLKDFTLFFSPVYKFYGGNAPFTSPECTNTSKIVHIGNIYEAQNVEIYFHKNNISLTLSSFNQNIFRQPIPENS